MYDSLSRYLIASIVFTGVGDGIYCFSPRLDGIASNRYFPRLDRKIKSVTEERPFCLARPLCSSIVSFAALRPQFVLQEPFSHSVISPLHHWPTRLDSTRLCPTLPLLPALPGVNTLCPNKKTLNCCAAYYEKSLGANSGICREKLARDCSRDNGGAMPFVYLYCYSVFIFSAELFTTFSF